MKVLLTGATGFIGSHVARALVRQGHEIHALVRPGSDLSRIADIQSSLRLVAGDLLNSSFALPSSSFDLAVHLAWYVEPGKYLTSPQNVEFLCASLRFAKHLADSGCKRLVAAGTCFEYDTDLGVLSESCPTRPRHLYAASKLALYHALEGFYATKSIEFAWTRFFYLYGPFENPGRLVPVVVNGLLKGETVKLPPGEQVRDYLHIEDVAGAVCAVAASRLTGAVNIGSGQPVAVRDVALKIGEIIGRPELISLGALPQPPDDPMRIVADNSRLVQNTNWKPRYTLESGLQHTIEWWKHVARPGS